MQKGLIIAFVLLALCACGRRAEKTNSLPALKVRTMVVVSHTTNVQTRYVGTVEPISETPLSMQTTGRIVSIRVKNGDHVRKGQLLIAVDSTQTVNALHTAEAARNQAQDAFRRLKQVYGKGAVTDQKMVEIESQVERAEAMYEMARQQVMECKLTAPCDGVISGLDMENGQTVVPGVRICSILDLTAFNVRFTVPEGEIKNLYPDSRTPNNEYITGEVECTALDTVFPIRITEKSMKANPVTHTYDVKARVMGGADVLMTGMVGKVTVVDNRKPDSGNTTGDIVIPANCILLKPEGPTVWVKENGQAVRRGITIDGYQADGVRVKSGLTEGDSLITEGYQKLYIGCAVIEE